MELNTGFTDFAGGPLSLHKLQVVPLRAASEGESSIAFGVPTASSLT